MFQAPDISFYIISLGCAKNLVDSERVNGEMRALGFRAAQSSEDADILIVNTCGFIEDAKKESIEVILDAVGIKDDAPSGFGRKLVAAGCRSQRYRREVAAESLATRFRTSHVVQGFFVFRLDLVFAPFGFVQDCLVAATEG